MAAGGGPSSVPEGSSGRAVRGGNGLLPRLPAGSAGGGHPGALGEVEAGGLRFGTPGCEPVRSGQLDAGRSTPAESQSRRNTQDKG